MIATLYDVHGNLRALEAVLAEVPDEATIVVGGDVCTGGAQPGETLERLRALGDRVVWICGNADRELAPDGEPTVPAEFIEIVGRYNPQHEPSLIELDEEKVRGWLQKGAQPTEPVARLLKAKGIS